MKNDPTLTIVDNGTRQTPAPGKPRDRSKSPTRDKPTRPLPSSRIAFEKQLDILRGYAAGSGPGNNPVSSSDVADIVKVAESSFYLVNPFFCDIGLLQRVEQAGQASKYLPCADVCTFAKAYEWNRETAAYKLAPVIRASWFADALLRKLREGSASLKPAARWSQSCRSCRCSRTGAPTHTLGALSGRTRGRCPGVGVGKREGRSLMSDRFGAMRNGVLRLEQPGGWTEGADPGAGLPGRC